MLKLNFIVLYFLFFTACSSHNQKPQRGFKIQHLEKDTSLAKLGLESGDIIKEINGTPINSLNSAQKELSNLKSEGKINILILRNGELIKLNYLTK